MSLSIEPQSKDLGMAGKPINISVEINGDEGDLYTGETTVNDSTGKTINIENFESDKSFTYSPNLTNAWDNIAEGQGQLNIAVSSYIEEKEEAVNGSSSDLYLIQDEFIYDGEPKIVKLNGYDPDKMILAGKNSEINPGEYSLHVRLKDGYYWSGETTDEEKYMYKNFKWRIKKGRGFINIGGNKYLNGFGYDVSFTGSDSSKSIVLSGSGTTFSITEIMSSPSGVCSAYINGDELYIAGNKEGSAYYNLTVAETRFYESATIKINVTSNVYKVVSSLPYQTNTLTTSFPNGDLVVLYPTWSHYDTNAIELTGQLSGWVAMSYTAYARLKSGYRWWDGTTADKPITWVINGGGSSSSSPVTLSDYSVTVSYYSYPQTAIVSLFNHYGNPVRVIARCGSGRGPFAMFDSYSTPSIQDVTTIGIGGSATLYITAGSPAPYASGDIRLEYIDPYDKVIGTDTISVTISN